MSFVLLCLGCLVAGFGSLWIIMTAFSKGIVWGLAVVFLPIFVLVFVVTYWHESKKPFFIQVIGIGLILWSLHLSPIKYN